MGRSRRVGITLGLLLLAAATDARAQFGVPSIPGGAGGLSGLSGAAGGLSGLSGAASPIAAPIGGVPAAATTAVPASSGNTLWSFLGITPQNCAACKAKLCGSQFGQLLNSGMGPIGALSGGLLPPICPTTPSAADLAAAMAAGGAQGTAAQIKAAMAEAKAKIAAIEYLATVDCGIWPEAETSLIDSLRSERVECVRFAAARALGTGCCCTEKTAAALTNVLEGSTADGGIFERSERVKAASYMALCRCVNKYIPKPPKRRPEVPNVPQRPESPARPTNHVHPELRTSLAATDEHLRLVEYYRHIEHLPTEEILNRARAAIARSVNAPWGDQILPTGSRSLYHAVAKATGPGVNTPRSASTAHAVLASVAPPPLIPSAPRPVLSLVHEEPLPPNPPATLETEPSPPPPIPRSFPVQDRSLESSAPPIPQTLPLQVPQVSPPPLSSSSMATPARALTEYSDPAQSARARTATRPAGQRSLLEIFAAARRP
jgi:hypothetical protein